jgi:1-deoxy-D-xylulose 5-phosphate reductoisomerase
MYRTVLAETDTIHAFCEFRQRQRNAQLGEAPTISELAEIINKPEQKNPEVDMVNLSATPTLEPRLKPITTDFLPQK